MCAYTMLGSNVAYVKLGDLRKQVCYARTLASWKVCIGGRALPVKTPLRKAPDLLLLPTHASPRCLPNAFTRFFSVRAVATGCVGPVLYFNTRSEDMDWCTGIKLTGCTSDSTAVRSPDASISFGSGFVGIHCCHLDDKLARNVRELRIPNLDAFSNLCYNEGPRMQSPRHVAGNHVIKHDTQGPNIPTERVDCTVTEQLWGTEGNRASA